MGGIQVIAVGCFYQLRPVPNRWTQDKGEYAFQSMLWEWIFPHKFILKTVHRQSDSIFINAINEIARGCPSVQTVNVMRQQDDGIIRKLELHSTRLDVRLSNDTKLASHPGDIKVYFAEESNSVSRKMRKSIDAPTALCLKLNVPVILTVNLSHRLVNGLGGIVKEFRDDCVCVYFTDLKQTHDIGFHNFFQYNRMSCKQVFVVRQIPLLLSFALTIHKSQGMTLKSVMVNCEGAFDPGQLGVALSRVRDINDMSVLNFRAGLCPPHPPCVNAYYGSIQEGLHHDLSCCNLTYGDFLQT